MNKTKERNLRKQNRETLGDDYRKTDEVLIDELIDWMKINVVAKQELAKALEERGEMPWTVQTTISMCSKNIQSLYTKLGLTPQIRMNGKKKEIAIEVEKDVDINSLLQ
jgi:hypothetical protein